MKKHFHSEMIAGGGGEGALAAAAVAATARPERQPASIRIEHWRAPAIFSLQSSPQIA